MGNRTAKVQVWLLVDENGTRAPFIVTAHEDLPRQQMWTCEEKSLARVFNSHTRDVFPYIRGQYWPDRFAAQVTEAAKWMNAEVIEPPPVIEWPEFEPPRVY